ncbi:MAG: YihY/virulence factor BrkB family protein [Candidatus Aminicenantes bacterium]|nr:YihY/virulence factor BrkB family protein [Candidatus Aminicenantes bacterium]
MKIKEFNIFRNAWVALKEFFQEDGLDKSSILAYYSIFSSLFLFTFFTFLFTKFLGDPNMAIEGMYPFSPDFFSKISPELLKKAQDVSSKLREVGIIGILIFLFLAFLIIKKVVQFVNEMFNIKLKDKKSEKGFLTRRISEVSLLFIIGSLLIISFLFSGFISTITTLFNQNQFIATHIHPGFIDFLNTFFLKYVAPFFITFLYFFILYKWIPEKKVYMKGAFIAAIISTILWELIKRAYTYYLVNISFVWQIKGPLIAIILFGFWMEISMSIMLYGAKLTYIFDRGKNDKIKKNN